MAKRNAVIFFLKYPRMGTVKNRLAQTIGKPLALGLYQCFVRDVLAALMNLDCPLHIFLRPAEDIPAMRDWLGLDLPMHPQQGSNLGGRMQNAFEEMFGAGYDHCILLGSDFPDLPPAVPRSALQELDHYGAVIVPAADGGYCLVGFRRHHFCPAIFADIPWSTDAVFNRTMGIFRREGIPVKSMPQWWDVDDYADLVHLMRRYENHGPGTGRSRTLEFLRQHWREIFRQ